MSEEEEQSHLFDGKLRIYEDRLVEILLNIGQSKRVNPKMAAISCYLLIHEKLTQREIKELTGFSMGTVSTYLSVMIGTGNFQKIRVPHTHTFFYTFSGKLEVLTTRAIEVALSSLGSIEIYLKNKNEILKKLIKQNKKGAIHLSNRIEELLDGFEIYKKIFPSNGISAEEIRTQISPKSLKRSKDEKEEVKEVIFDPEVYYIEDDIINQLLVSPMFSSRDPMFIRILGLLMTRKYITQKTLKRITGLSSGKISEEVNQLLEDKLIYKTSISDKGKITYGADFLILLRFSRYIINHMTKWLKELETMKLELENNKSELETLDGYTQIYRIYDYTLNAISIYSEYIQKIDKFVM
ncbi:MAG: MarR family transcriptional regulator [Promethearchaeota archaeon]|jgi:DNA-binding transcriptional regulator GbsR (MarR family)